MTVTTDHSAVAAAAGREPTITADVAIAGAGFAGLATAIALADGLPPGARVVLIDREPGEPPRDDGGNRANLPRDGRAVALTVSSVRLLTALGIWSGIADLAQPVSGIEITDSALKAGIRPVVLAYDTEVASGEPSMYIVPNASLVAALANAASRRPAIISLRGCLIERFSAGPDTASAVLDDGRRIEARLLVACDGRKSRLRGLAGIGTVGWPYHQHGITVIIAHDKPHRGLAVQHFLPGGPFALLPLPGNRTCVTWSEGEAEAARIMALDDDAFLDELDRRVGGRLGGLSLDGPRQSWPLDMFLSRAFVSKRFALVGDAAHGVHPIAGQGLNLGFKDVAALAEAVVDQARLGLDIGAPEPLARYERWRRMDTMTAAAGFDALNRLFSNDIGLLRSLRLFGLETIDRVPFLKRRLVEEAAGVTGQLPRLLRGEPV